MNVYCDTGGFRIELREMELVGLIKLHQVKYENRNRRLQTGGFSSNLTYDDSLHYTYNDLKKDGFFSSGSITCDEMRAATARSRFTELLELVGPDKKQDARHLDSAITTGCVAFLTSDRDDIACKKEVLLASFGLHVFHVTHDWHAFMSFVENHRPAVTTPTQKA